MNHTMATQNSKSASIAGSSGKRSITGGFTVTLDDRFLPMHLIYGRKTKQSFPRFKFPDGFSLNCNSKHFSNIEKSIKIAAEVNLPYVKIQPAALVIIDVLRWCNLPFEKNDIHSDLVPNNMAQCFQPLYLTVNEHCNFLRRDCSLNGTQSG